MADEAEWNMDDVVWHPTLGQWVGIKGEGTIKVESHEVVKADPYPTVDGNLKNERGRAKRQLQLVPLAGLEGFAEAMEDGARKYGPFNWREGRVEYMQYLGAILRHTTALIDGEDEATDSHLHHLKHVGATAAIILDAIKAGVLVDDRPGFMEDRIL